MTTVSDALPKRADCTALRYLGNIYTRIGTAPVPVHPWWARHGLVAPVVAAAPQSCTQATPHHSLPPLPRAPRAPPAPQSTESLPRSTHGITNIIVIPLPPHSDRSAPPHDQHPPSISHASRQPLAPSSYSSSSSRNPRAYLVTTHVRRFHQRSYTTELSRRFSDCEMPENVCRRPCWNKPSICSTDSLCPRKQVSVFYFVTTVVGMIVLALFTLLFLFCLFLKRRRIQLRLNPRPRGDEMRAYETSVTFYPANEVALPVTNPADGDKKPVEPFTCVIMAGEDQPTFIAHPMPSSTSTSTPSEVKQEQQSSSTSNADGKS